MLLFHFKSQVQAFFPALEIVLISTHIGEPYADTDISVTDQCRPTDISVRPYSEARQEALVPKSRENV